MASSSGATSSGATAITISSTRMLRVLVPFISELFVVGTLRAVTGETTTPSCTKGISRVLFGRMRASGVAMTLAPMPGMARSRHIHGNADHQIHVVAFLQLIHATSRLLALKVYARLPRGVPPAIPGRVPTGRKSDSRK